MKSLRPEFDVPSSVTLTRDADQLYLDQKKQLKSLLIENSQRVCLTTQTWTSMQQIDYMALKVHFIDSDWKLHRKMLNFCQVPDDNEETESLIDVHESIDSIRNAVRYVKSSPKGLLKFKACIEHEGIEFKGYMVLDVPTRWNTTYLMLRDNLKFQKAFEKLEEDDEDYGSHFLEDESGLKMIGPPTVVDWENVRAIVRF
ncbi:hypothetical protein ACFX1S_008495 [Malus domestica]